MAHNRELFQAILDDPDDDTRRLVYADWLEENGDANRAEFIRAQMELAQSPKPRSQTRRRILEGRVRRLWKLYGAEWAKQPGGGNSRLDQWESGFCARYHSESLALLIEEFPRRVAESPLRELRFSLNNSEDLAGLLAQPFLSQIRSLSLDFIDIGADLSPIANCPYLTQLKSLYLDCTIETFSAGLSTLAHAANMPVLRDLDLSDYGLRDDGILALANSPMAPRVRVLCETLCYGITFEGMRALAAAPQMTNVRQLDFRDALVGDDGVQCIARAPHFAGLRRLELSDCQIGNAGVKAIASSPFLADLETLDLSYNPRISRSAAVALVESTHLKKISRLDLRGCDAISPSDERKLRKRFGYRVLFEDYY